MTFHEYIASLATTRRANDSLDLNAAFALQKLIEAITIEEVGVIYDNEDIDSFFEAKAWLERHIDTLMGRSKS